jgi:5-enolpyruvylshikimate-3-phosphate synthase
MVMALAIAGMAVQGITTVDTAESASVTYPSFLTDMKRLGGNLELVE